MSYENPNADMNYDWSIDGDVYSVDCLCGKELESTSNKITCPVCGRIWLVKVYVEAELIGGFV